MTDNTTTLPLCAYVCVCADVLRWWQLAGVKGFPAVLERRSFELKAKVISSPFIFPPAERKKGLPQRPASMSAVEFEKPFSGSQMFCQVRVKVNWIHIRTGSECVVCCTSFSCPAIAPQRGTTRQKDHKFFALILLRAFPIITSN